jgi:hypothetical protein
LNSRSGPAGTSGIWGALLLFSKRGAPRPLFFIEVHLCPPSKVGF